MVVEFYFNFIFIFNERKVEYNNRLLKLISFESDIDFF